MKDSEFSNPHSLERDLERRKKNAMPLSSEYINSAMNHLEKFLGKKTIPNHTHESAEFIAVVCDCLHYMSNYKVDDNIPIEFRHHVEGVAACVTPADLDFNEGRICGLMHKYFFDLDPGFEGKIPVEILEIIFDNRFEFFSRFLGIMNRTKFVKPYIVKLSESDNKAEKEFASKMLEWLIFN